MIESPKPLTQGEKGYIMEGLDVDFREFLYLMRRQYIGVIQGINVQLGIQPICPYCGHDLSHKDYFSHAKK